MKKETNKTANILVSNLEPAQQRILNDIDDADISSLSTVKLLSIKQLSRITNLNIDTHLLENIEMELANRGGSQEWHLPH